MTTQYIIDGQHFLDQRTAQSFVEKMLRRNLTVTICVMPEALMNTADLEHKGVQMEMFELDEIAKASLLRDSDNAVTLVMLNDGVRFAIFNKDGFCGIHLADYREEQHSAGPVTVYEFPDWPPPCWRRPER